MSDSEMRTAAVPRSPLRRFLAPLMAVLVPLGFFVLLKLWMDFEWEPAAILPLFMGFQISFVLAGVVLLVWWLFYSGFLWQTRFVVLAGVALLPVIAMALIRKVEFTGDFAMRPIFRWEDDPNDLLDRDRSSAQQQPADGLPPIDLTIGPTDYAQYRGPKRDGVAHYLPIATDWVAKPPKVLWRQPAGGGYAGFAVAGNIAVTIEQRRDQEAVVGYDRKTGRERWLYSYPAYFQQSEPMGGSGPRATPTISGGDVYSLGAQGDLVCLNGQTGQRRWSVNLLEDNHAKNTTWGMTGSPLVVGDLVVVNPGIDPDKNSNQAVAAYDRKSGKRVWSAGNQPASYSSPQLARLANVDQILLFDAGGLVGLQLTDGRELWRQPWKTFSDMNIIQPLVLHGDRVLISSEMANGSALLQLRHSSEQWSVEEVWQSRSLCSKYANPVAFQEHIYGMSNGILTCVELATGKRCWKGGRYGHGQLLLTGDILLISTETGALAAVLADPGGFNELGKFALFDGKTWNTPALAGNQLFLRNHHEMACLELPAK